MATVTLRPDATAALAGWALGGGAGSAHAATNDNSDSTWVYGEGDGRLVLDLTTFTLPALARVVSLTPRVRAALTGTLGHAGMTLRLGGVDHATSQFGPQDATIRGYTGSPRTTRPDGQPWLQADIDAVQFVGICTYLFGPTIYEAYVDVLYNEAPVATVSAPTGAISTTNKPPVVWSYSDPDGDAQERFEVKIFTAATIAAVGFNPETSTPATGSGVVTDSTPSWTPAIPLSSGVTYTAYVKVADAGSGGRYGNWAAGPTFTIAAASGLMFDPPAIPTVVSASPDPANNRVAVAVAGADNELTRNQSSGESGVAGWTAVTNVAAGYPQRTAAAGSFLNGLAGIVMRSAAAGTMTVRSVSAITLAALRAEAALVLPGQVRTSLVSFKSAAAVGRTATLTATYYDAAGTIVGSATTGPAVTVTTGGWTQAAVGTTVPALGLYEVLSLNLLGAVAASEDIYFDQASSAPGTSTVWTRGGLVQDTGRVADTFTRANSASTLGSSEGPGTPAWSALSGTWGITSNRAYLVSATSQAVATLSSLALTDGVVTCDITLSATANRAAPGLVLRAADNSNYLLVALAKVGTGTDDSIGLYKNVAGAFTNLASYSSAGLVNGATYGVKVELYGGLVRVYIDRQDGLGYTKVIDHQLAAADVALYTAAANTKHGLRINNGALADDGGSRFDNYVAGNPATQAVIVERSVDAGATWAVVRSINGEDLTDPGQTGTFFDYEAPRGIPVQYRARTLGTESDITVYSAYSPALAMTPDLASDGQSWLKLYLDPALNTPVCLVKDSVNSTSTEDMTVYEPLGRPTPLIHGGTIRAEVFDGLEFWFATDADWDAFEVLRRRQVPLLLQSCYGDDGLDEWWVRLGPTRSVSRVTSSDMSREQKRAVRIAAREVAGPAVP